MECGWRWGPSCWCRSSRPPLRAAFSFTGNGLFAQSLLEHARASFLATARRSEERCAYFNTTSMSLSSACGEAVDLVPAASGEMKGLFITFEGTEGSGKSTHIT